MIVRDKQLVYTRTDREVRADFENLCALPAENMIELKTFVSRGCPMPRKLHLYRTMRTGQMLAERFHWRDRVHTGTVHHPEQSASRQLQRWTADPAFLKQAHERLRRVSPSPDEEAARFKTIMLNSTLLTLTHFRASVSKHLCDTLVARRVLDFSAGWGDRTTGFLASASVEDITLIDPRASSLRACRAQHAFVRSTKRLRTYQKGAEDVMRTLPSNAYDLIVTSPPYFDLEHYGTNEQDARGQIRLKVSTPQDYIRVFLEPVLRECARVLAPRGIVAINVDDNPQKGVFLCKPTMKILSAQPGMVFLGTAGLRKGKGFGQGIGATDARAEPIYLFMKAKP